MSNKLMKLFIITMVFLAIAVPLSGCTTEQGATATPTATPLPSTAPAQTLKLATTTSVNDSGLLGYILPDFEKANNVKVQVLSAGSGQALAYAASGDVDVVIVHSPSLEKTFMDEGHGWNKTQFAHNFYVIVGPASDPAGVKGMTNATQAYKKIADKQATFVARVDNSGTDTWNKGLWNKTGLGVPDNKTNTWYVATGSGMADTLRMASEKQAYTLSDISTFLSQQKNLQLVVLMEDDPANLINKYDVIAVNQTQHPTVNYAMALKLIDYLKSQPGQQKIAGYGQAQYGRPLFFADLLNNTTST